MFGSALDIEQAFAHPGSMSRRTRVRRRRLAAFVVVAGLAASVSGPVANAVVVRGDETGARRTYVVRSGDTLWSIASRFEPALDPRFVVDAIEAANRLDPEDLVPGQELVIPATG
jgi:nucleoid-associated protein YgaU